MTKDDILNTLFSHGLDLERYMDCSLVDGAFHDDLFFHNAQLTNEFASALDLLIGTYDTLIFFHANMKENANFARVLFDKDSGMAERWALLHPSVEYFPPSVKTHLIDISDTSGCTSPISWITSCRLQAYIFDSHVIRLNNGGTKSYGRVCFFANSVPVVYDEEKCNLDFKHISFPAREKVACACCRKVVAAYKSTQANDLYFCSIVDDRKRADRLDNISLCARTASNELYCKKFSNLRTEDIVKFMQPSVSLDSPREFVVEIMRKFLVPIRLTCRSA